MRSLSLLISLLALTISNVSATALTYKLAANEKACFYTTTTKQDVKVAFYFAVCRIFLVWCFIFDVGKRESVCVGREDIGTDES